MSIFTKLWNELKGQGIKPGVAEILAHLPHGVDPVLFIQLAITVLAKTSLAIQDTDAAAKAHGLDIHLDLQAVKDIEDLLGAASHVFDAFEGRLVSAKLPTAA